MSLIQTEQNGAVGTLILNHTDKRNALSEALILEVVAALDRFREARLRAVVLRAPRGAKVWSAGHDVNELPERGRDPLGWNDPLRLLVRSLQEFPAPVIALIEGGVWGGGCEVALACDILVATPEVTFAVTPAKLGVPYNLGGVLTFMNMIPLPVLKEMLFTAQPIPASQALNLGVINYIKPADEIERVVYEMAERIAANSPLCISVMKEELHMLASAYSVTPEVFERVQGMRRVVYDSFDYQEGRAAFKARRPPAFKGC